MSEEVGKSEDVDGGLRCNEGLGGDTEMGDACEVPLVEKLRSVPKDYKTCFASAWTADGREIGYTFIPVGYMMHEAADEIERLRRMSA